MITLSAAFLVEESLYSLFLNVSDETIVPFFWAYIGLIVFTMMTVLLFRMVSMDADRKNRYQTEIAMLSLTRQHQQELSQMYEDLTQRQHDYKHHLQTLQELVTGSGESTAKAYLETVLKDTDAEDMIVTGNPGVDALLAAKGEPPAKNSQRLADLVRRPKLTYDDLAPLDPDRPALPRAVTEQVEISLKYAGYIARQQRQVEEMRRLEGRLLPEDLDYQALTGLRLEARQKLANLRPRSLGQASRISGVSPADVAALMIHLERLETHDPTGEEP